MPPVPARRNFRRRLLAWYDRHGRTLPWRETSDPYHILVSEIMLQQTQVDRVLPKYREWLEKYPSLEALADAPERDVTETWRPLGYNIRPKRLQAIAREAVASYGGRLPSDEATLLSFKGIGAYTAGAIRSFAFRERAAILDTNVARVLFRVFIGQGSAESARHEEGFVEHFGGARPEEPRVRFQSGADGLRRDALHREKTQVPDLPHGAALLGVPAQSREREAWLIASWSSRLSSRRTGGFSLHGGSQGRTSPGTGNSQAAKCTIGRAMATRCGGKSWKS